MCQILGQLAPASLGQNVAIIFLPNFTQHDFVLRQTHRRNWVFIMLLNINNIYLNKIRAHYALISSRLVIMPKINFGQ